MENVVSDGGGRVDLDTRREFESLAREQIPHLYGLARRLTEQQPEDLVQECLLKAYRSFATLQTLEAGPRWLQTILLNLFRDRLRKQATSLKEVPVDDVDEFSLFRTIADEDPFPYSDTLHLDFLHAFGTEDVRAVLLRLPEIYRAPLVLRYIQGYSTKEITKMLDAPLGTILAQLHRGRKLFERELWSYARENELLEPEDSR
jgi:RNA polymerase sigma-70 factor (ECF subfamily)